MNLLIGTRVPAVNSTNRLLVYFQDVYDSIPESLYEGSRANGTEKNVIGKAKLGSPVAATSKELNNGIPTRSLPTTLEADDTTAAWAVPSSKLPYSGIAAVFLAGTDAFQLRSYVQKSDNTIQEYMWNGNGWEEGTNLGTASPVLVSEPPPSAILTTMAQASEIHRIWFQTDDLRRVQRAYDPHKGWYPNLSAIFDKAPPRTAIAATSFGAGNSSIYMRIFLSTWTTLSGRSAGTTARAITTSQPSLQRGSFANNGPDLGLYFQNGTYCVC
ncbi:aldo-keto reductase yakc [NADP(+)] [Aspergillus lentulus]|uniref:Fucose-specific lectin n=1 Tax=Aspergillus lentulus TaxID=293939 RepID=A0ABQ1AI63_ASPLE|nr:aldo-keto reductase yakc [NADP(+)] [Aspergillus lentulus]GFG06075.1 aldo-keto reductase yakc [NADP(+)] [Aspergillus lentulus]